ncbi:MAG: YihY/virulence factor BrkB family protein [Gemmatimonadota bacterium]|nr:YihY/virulence factor BrkB family protein [Gemmatimonadota bacterium]
MLRRTRLAELRWTTRDYLARMWDNAFEDNFLFLASGVAFDILLASVPFVITLVSGVTFVLNLSPALSNAEILDVVDHMLPHQTDVLGRFVHRVIDDALRGHHSLGIWSAIIFLFLSTRLFASLRIVLAEVFDIETRRGIIEGKLFDVKMTLVASVLFVANAIIAAYLAIARSRGVELLQALGIREDVMGGVEYAIGRLVAFAFLFAMFFAIYRYLPARRVRWQTAAVASAFTSVLFEVAKQLFALVIRHLNAASVYTGVLAAVIVVVVWVYYAAIVFILGGEVGQVYELRRTRRLQREALSE